MFSFAIVKKFRRLQCITFCLPFRLGCFVYLLNRISIFFFSRCVQTSKGFMSHTLKQSKCCRMANSGSLSFVSKNSKIHENDQNEGDDNNEKRKNLINWRIRRNRLFVALLPLNSRTLQSHLPHERTCDWPQVRSCGTCDWPCRPHMNGQVKIRQKSVMFSYTCNV